MAICVGCRYATMEVVDVTLSGPEYAFKCTLGVQCGAAMASGECPCFRELKDEAAAQGNEDVVEAGRAEHALLQCIATRGERYGMAPAAIDACVQRTRQALPKYGAGNYRRPAYDMREEMLEELLDAWNYLSMMDVRGEDIPAGVQRLLAVLINRVRGAAA